MDWIPQITAAFATAKNAAECDSKAGFFPPASVEEIAEAECRLNATFPQALQSLLLETNGVMSLLSVHGSDWFDNMWLILPLEEILAENDRAVPLGNQSVRDQYQTLFFAGAGCDGIQFGFPIGEGQRCEDGIVVWHPSRETLTPIASSLETFIAGWLEGTIQV